MSYATQQDLVDRFGSEELTQLTDRDNTGEIDADVIARALADTAGEIDGYIGSAYTLPLASIPQILVGYASDIARYKLFNQDAPEEVRNRYNAAIKFMAMVGQKKLTLGLADGQPVATAGGVKYTAPGRVFNDQSLDGFR